VGVGARQESGSRSGRAEALVGERIEVVVWAENLGEARMHDPGDVDSEPATFACHPAAPGSLPTAR